MRTVEVVGYNTGDDNNQAQTDRSVVTHGGRRGAVPRHACVCPVSVVRALCVWGLGTPPPHPPPLGAGRERESWPMRREGDRVLYSDVGT